ncbi:MAG: arginine--tRNA ligase [Phycisphaerales bacterium]|nr:arginine--tRNA ligase [Phycisphaerales bacterium]
MTTNIKKTISDILASSFGEVLGVCPSEIDPVVKRSQNQKLGDFQANGAMAIGKRVGQNPRELAERVVGVLDFGDVAYPPEVAGPGFINIRLTDKSIISLIEEMDSPDLGVTKDQDTHPVAVDLCAVNVAKQLHVGHLRSTIIGDSIARMFERVGRTVYRENHIGDWGLPIAMVLEQLLSQKIDLDSILIEDLNIAYKSAQLVAKDELRGLEAAQKTQAGPHRLIEIEEQNIGAISSQTSAKVVLNSLQQNDKQLLEDWQKIIKCTMASVYESLGLLNVKLGPEHVRGESFYRDKLADVVNEFVSVGLAEEDDGAIVVRFKDRDRPMIIRKSDGGFLYSTTDLAAIKHRTQVLKSDCVIYVVDSRQKAHFKDLFDAAKLIGWDHTPDGTKVEFVHVSFGSVLGENKKPIKTRSGSSITLHSMLEDAIKMGTSEVTKRSKDENSPTHKMCEEELKTIGRQIGIGAIKYADLSNDLVRDYVFDLNRMIAFEGNTGPYIQYACARISSLIKKGGVDRSAVLIIKEPQERALALKLLQHGDVLQESIKYLEPHRLCTWLYELTDCFSSFYQSCPVLKLEDEKIKQSRLRLADLTRRVIVDGLDLLGIESPEQM